MTRYSEIQDVLRRQPRRWLVTGCAGFIGSHLLERLLLLGQEVVGLDNFSTGFRANLDDVRGRVGEAWDRFTFHEGDITEATDCERACRGVEIVLHQAALGSVPRSLQDPFKTHRVNVDGFVNMIIAARDAGVSRFVFASSSSVYGDDTSLPKVERVVGRALSPYALSKAANEDYAEIYHRCFGLETVGLRYFNVFGPRQDPGGAYAAVIPRWVGQLLTGERCVIYGDGETSRDFCYVANAVQANVLAGVVEGPDVAGRVFNIAVGDRTTLNDLFRLIRDGLSLLDGAAAGQEPLYGPFRAGDVRHSQASIERAAEGLGYVPTHTIADGLEEALPWYVATSARPGTAAERRAPSSAATLRKAASA